MEPDRPQQPRSQEATNDDSSDGGGRRQQTTTTTMTGTRSSLAAFATPPRPILIQPGSSNRSLSPSKGRLSELRQPELARAAGRERTHVLPSGPVATDRRQDQVEESKAEGSSKDRPLGPVVTFGGLGPSGSGGPAESVPGPSASGGQQQQATPGSVGYAPRFAEQFSTPLRRRLRAGSLTQVSSGGMRDSPLAARVPTPPGDDVGETDDLYRGPLPPPEAPTRRTFRFDTSGRQLDEDAVSLRSMSTADSSSTHSSSSSSSRASVVSFVVGAFEAVGRGLGVLGSASLSSSSSSSSSSDSGRHRRHRKKRSRRRSSVSTARGTAADLEAVAGSSRRRSRQQNRTKTRARHRLRRLRRLRAFSVGSVATSRRSSSSSGSSSSSSSRSRSSSTSSSSDDEPLGRRKVVGTREFRLMLPGGPDLVPAPDMLAPPTPAALADLPIPLDGQGGTIVTQSLDEIIMAINRLRSAEFHVPTPPPPPAHSEQVPPLTAPIPRPGGLPHLIQIPPTAYDTARPLTPSQILNIAVPAAPPPLELAHTHALQPSAIPPRLSRSGGVRIPPAEASLAGSRTSSLRRELQPQSVPEVRIDRQTPVASPAIPSPEKDGSPSGSCIVPAMTKSKDAFWLDVSCPTWEDMRSLGELLQLHPLTLEDILQQDPREKLEVFAALDYYLISFRALDESYFRYTDDGPEGTAADVSGSRRRRKGRGRVEIVEDRPGKEGLEGVGVGGINLYIVVMPDGVVSFHFEDVKKHVAAVTDRVQALESGFQLSSDWIAHMFMDSMVDVFMPLIDFIEEEADLIDSQIIHHDGQVESPLARLADAEDAFVAEERRRLSLEEDEREAAEAAVLVTAAEPAADGSSANSDEYVQKQRAAGLEAHELKDRRSSSTSVLGRSGPGTQPSAIPPMGTPTVAEWLRSHFRWLKVEKGDFIVLRRLVLALYPLIARILIILSLHPAQRYARRQRRAAKRGPRVETHDFDRKAMLKHMVGMRRLVTGLNRLLVPKLEVVGRLRKRAADNRSGARLGTDVGEQMATYFGDIQDHILSMQQTLAYGEHVLSQSQQAYLAQLNVTLASIKNSTQSSILTLSIVTIGVLAPTVVTGLNSLNVYIPHNGDPHASPPPAAPHILFGIIAGVVILFLIGFVLLVRYWKRSAKRRFRKKREAFY